MPKKEHLVLIFSLLFFILFTPFRASAAWNNSPYNPGETLNPECAPTEDNCTVTLPISSQWSNNEGSIYYNDGFVGIGNNAPNYNLDVNGDINFTGTLYQNGTPFSGSQWTDQGEGVLTYTNGSVGIGTTNPTATLDVNGNLKISGLGNGLYFPDGTFMGTSASTTTGITTPDDLSFAADSDLNGEGQIVFATNGNPVMNIVNNGFVGIGTTNPLSMLDIATTSSGQNTLLTLQSNFGSDNEGSNIAFRDTNVPFFADPAASIQSVAYAPGGAGLAFSTNQGEWGDFGLREIMRLTPFGNVGIGTDHPFFNLDVNGDINFTGNLYKNGELYAGLGASSSPFIDDGTEVYYNGGNYVGIGTNNPTESLDVNGITQANAFYITPSTIGNLRGGFIGDGLNDESNRQTLNLGLNFAQFGDRDTSLGGSILRFDARDGKPVMSVVYDTPGHTGGGGDESFPFMVTTNGNVLVGNAWGGDNNTGTGNGEDLQVHGTGFFGTGVGIGTNAGSYALNVDGDVNFSGNLYQNGVAFTGGGSSPFTDDNSNVYYNGNENVGIGTNSPNAKLSLGSALGNKIALYDGAPGAAYGFGIQNYLLQMYTDTSSSDMQFGYGGDSSTFTPNVTFKGNGNVGIGTTTPLHKLDVYGTFGVTNTSFVGNVGGLYSFWYGGSNPEIGGMILSTQFGPVDVDDYAPQGVENNYAGNISGFIKADYSETYTIHLSADDGVRLWIDGNLVIDDWNDQATCTAHTATVNLVKNKWTAIKIEHYVGSDATGECLHLSWESNNQSLQIIPADHMALPSDGVVHPLTVSNGFVGVNNVAPGFNLDVSGDINFTGNIYHNGSLFSDGKAASTSPFTDDGTYVTYTGGENIGIGTATPAYALDVNGAIGNSNGNLTFNAGMPNSVTSVAAPARGSIKINTQPADGDTVTVSDGSRSTVFEFDSDNSVASGHYAVEIDPVTIIGTASNFNNAIIINHNLGNLSVHMDSGEDIPTRYFPLVNDNNGPSGNVFITKASSALSVSGMWGGADDATGSQLVLTTSGNLGVGVLSPTHKLDVGGDIFASGDICSQFSNGCMSSFSDMRLKTNITNLAVASDTTSTLDKLTALDAVTFNWNSTYLSMYPMMNGQTKNYGLIAQDVAKQFPDLVHLAPNGYYTLDYTHLTAVIIEAVKELYAKVNTLAEGIFDKIFAHEVDTSKLCVGDTCVTEKELQELLSKQNIAPSSFKDATSSTEESTSTPDIMSVSPDTLSTSTPEVVATSTPDSSQTPVQDDSQSEQVSNTPDNQATTE